MRSIVGIVAFAILCLFTANANAQTATPQGPCTSFTANASGTGSAVSYNSFNIKNICNYSVSTFICGYAADQENQSSCSLIIQTVDGAVNGSTTKTVPISPINTNNPVPQPFFFEYECPAGSTAITPTGAEPTLGAPSCTAAPQNINASVLPSAFAVQVGHTASAFATMIATSGSPTACMVGLPVSAPTGLTMTYQGTDPSTNMPNATINTPVNTVGGKATFVLSFSSTTSLQVTGQQLEYSCSGSVSPLSLSGISSIDMDFSSSAIANIVAEEQTPSNNGILTVPVNSSSAFAVATDNAGNATGAVTVSTDTGSASLPLTLTICQTIPSTGACMATPASSVSLSIIQNATPTFSVFAAASSSIALSPATNRIFVRFRVGSVEVGATSVAVQS